jgi:hypothetical protein
MTERIILNVGGVVHETSRATLLLSGDSFLSRACQADVTFIDRNGQTFHDVLDFLRCGFLPDDDRALRRLKCESDFFCISSLSLTIENRLRQKNEAGSISATLASILSELQILVRRM